VDQLLGKLVPALPGGNAGPARSLRRAQGERLAMVAISVAETTADGRSGYAQKYGSSSRSALMPPPPSSDLSGVRPATHFFLDGDGVIRAIHLGPLTTAQGEAILAPLIHGHH